jgi:hypothetical protein
MQATLWCVLAAGFGLAALVDRHVGSRSLISLGPESINGPLHYRLPANWIVVRSREPTLLGRALDPAGRVGLIAHRTLSVYRQRLGRPMTPQDYLLAVGILDEVFGSADAAQPIGQTPMAGQPALVMQGQAEVQTPAGSVVESDLVVCCVFANRQAVTLWLARIGPLTSADGELIRQVAAAMKMDGIAGR